MLKQGQHVPEVLGGVIVLANLGMTALEVQQAVGVGGLLADDFNDSLRVGLGWVFALEDSLVVFGHHVCSCCRVQVSRGSSWEDAVPVRSGGIGPRCR